MRVFISNKNRWTSTYYLCERIREMGHKPIIIDRASSYPPLLEWYDETDVKVHRLNKDIGRLSFFSSGIFDQYRGQGNATEYFAFGDSDIDLSDVPDESLSVMAKTLSECDDILKVGFSLDCFNLPESERSNQIKDRESAFFDYRIEEGYLAPVADTLAVYDPRRLYPMHPKMPHLGKKNFLDALRTPWMANVPSWHERYSEEQYIINHANDNISEINFEK